MISPANAVGKDSGRSRPNASLLLNAKNINNPSLSARLRPFAEDRRSDPHMGGAKPYRDGVIAAHAHAQRRQTIAGGDFRQQREVRRGIVAHRRNAHQPFYNQAEFLPALSDEGIGLIRRNAGFLVFLAGIDLDEKAGRSFLPVHFSGKGAGDFRTVDRFNNIE